MTTVKLIIVFVSLMTLLSCRKDNLVETKNANVDQFVVLLKSGKYDAADLPAFTFQDIPALLTYRDEAQKISNFPRNGISSYYQQDCTLGLYILWTIESIRAVAINSKNLFGRFPSQNPLLEKSDYSELFLDTNESNKIASKAYYDWWTSNSRKDFNEFKNIDPLKNTVYKWH
ncbi:MAG: DUF4943 family protein [Candidatus Saccharibacteria bacterium]